MNQEKKKQGIFAFSNNFHSFLFVCKYSYISSSLKYLIKLLKQTVPVPFRIKVSPKYEPRQKKQGYSAFCCHFLSLSQYENILSFNLMLGAYYGVFTVPAVPTCCNPGVPGHSGNLRGQDSRTESLAYHGTYTSC